MQERRPVSLKNYKKSLVALAAATALVGSSTAVMAFAEPRYLSICPPGSTESGCATMLVPESADVPADATLATVELGGADGNEISLYNSNTSGSIHIIVVGFITNHPESTVSASFEAAPPSEREETVSVPRGQTLAVELDDVPTDAASVLLELDTSADGAPACDESEESEESEFEECDATTVVITTGEATMTAADARSLQTLRSPETGVPLTDEVIREIADGLGSSMAPDAPTTPDAVNDAVAPPAEPAPSPAPIAADPAPAPVTEPTPDRATSPSPSPSAPPTPKPSASPSPSPSPSVSPTPSPTQTPTPLPSPTQTQPPQPPPPSGSPGSGNTGVPAGTGLTVHHGDIRIKEAGRVISGLDVRGRIFVDAPNVRIENSIIRGPDAGVTGSSGLIVATGGHPGLVITDSELAPTVESGWINGIMGYNFTATRLNIHHVIDMVHVTGGNVTVESSWLHDNLHYANDPNQGGTPSHDDSIQIQAGRNIAIRNNNISGAFNSGIQITQDAGLVGNIAFTGNFADGGGCTINVSEKGRGSISGIVITDNKFGRNTKVRDCAVVAPSTSNPSMSDNFYTDGKIVTVTRGS